jgi:hypothetical protein
MERGGPAFPAGPSETGTPEWSTGQSESFNSFDLGMQGSRDTFW